MTPPVDQTRDSLTCALCGKPTRSVYALPGETKARLCAACFFKPVPVAAASDEERGGGEVDRSGGVSENTHPQPSLMIPTCPKCGKGEPDWWDCYPDEDCVAYSDLKPQRWVPAPGEQESS